MITLMYFKIASIMFWIFATFIIGIPLIMFIKTLIDDSLDDKSNGGGWKENPYLIIIDQLLDYVEAYGIGERVVASIITVIVCTLFWIVGIFVLMYVISKMNKKIREDKYNATVNK